MSTPFSVENPPPTAVICCVREAIEDEGSGHDVDCPGPGVLPSAYERDRIARWRR